MSKYYCFFNLDTKKIIRISPVNKTRETDPSSLVIANISDDLAKDLMIGKKSYSSIIVIRAETGYEAIEKEIIINEFKQTLDRIDTIPLKELYENTSEIIDLMTVKIRILLKSKIFIFDADGEILKCIREPIKFYITKKNDPSALLQSITVEPGITSYLLSKRFSNVSIFTKRIFNTYLMEIVNE